MNESPPSCIQEKKAFIYIIGDDIFYQQLETCKNLIAFGLTEKIAFILTTTTIEKKYFLFIQKYINNKYH